MFRTRLPLVASLLSATFLLSFLPAQSATISGTKCTKLNTIKTVSNIKYTCVKSGKNLIWNKGVTLKPAANATATPSPKPTQSTETATSNQVELKDGQPCTSTDQGLRILVTVGTLTCTQISFEKFKWKLDTSIQPNTTNTINRNAAQKFPTSPVSSFANLEVCKVPTKLTTEMNEGFPRSNRVVPSTGEVRGVTIFTQYTDLPEDGDQIRVWKTQQIPTAEHYFNVMSYGKLKLKIDLVEKIYLIPKSVLTYNLDTAHGTPMKPNANTSGLIKDAVEGANPDVDFSKYDFINVVTPATTKIGFEGANGIDLDADGKHFTFATFGPIREYKDDPSKFPWEVHELGHLFGLIHPYMVPSYSSDYGIVAWDIMGNSITFAPEFMAWNKFLLGWLDNNQINCIDGSSKSVTTSLITPIGANVEGTKAIFVKVSDTEILAIENRRTSEFNKIDGIDEGTIVYLVDQTIGDNKGAFTMIYNRLVVRKGHLFGTLTSGEKVTYKNVEVTIKSSAVLGDYVSVEVK